MDGGQIAILCAGAFCVIACLFMIGMIVWMGATGQLDLSATYSPPEKKKLPEPIYDL